jgi:hypothetical protein
MLRCTGTVLRSTWDVCLGPAEVARCWKRDTEAMPCTARGREMDNTEVNILGSVDACCDRRTSNPVSSASFCCPRTSPCSAACTLHRRDESCHLFALLRCPSSPSDLGVAGLHRPANQNPVSPTPPRCPAAQPLAGSPTTGSGTEAG